MTSQLYRRAQRIFVRKGGQNECLPRIAAICAVLAALVIFVAAAWYPQPAHADGGASARSQTTNPAADPPDTPQARAQRILRILADRRSNNWVRYWQARSACDAAADYARREDNPPLDRALLTLTAFLCAQLDARLGVNPDAYAPRGEERTVGLLLNEPGAAPGYTLFTGWWNNDVFLLDPLGRVAHTWHIYKPLPSMQTKLLNSGNLLVFGEGNGFEFDPSGNIVWQYKGDGRFHHDLIQMPNGNILLIVRKFKTREQAIAAGANPAFVHENGLNYDYLLEVRPTSASGGEIVWEWSPWDHLIQDFDPAKPNYGAIAEHPELIDINFLLESMINRNPNRDPNNRVDWLHANAIDYNPDLDQIMLSPRNFSELWIIDHSPTTEEARGHSGGNSGMGGDLLYRWGNPRAYNHGDADAQRLFWQHQTHWIPPSLPGAGNILAFNNGYEFPGHERFYSSVDEIVPPLDGYRYRRDDDAAYPPAEIAWTYAAETPADFYAPILSGAQRLPNGNTLIVDGPAGTIFQATPDGRIVWKYVAPLDERFHLRQGELPMVWKTYPTSYGDAPRFSNSVYRAYWLPPDHPGLQALDLTPGVYIEDMPDVYDRAYAAAIAGDLGERIAGSDFDIYLDDADKYRRRLIYIKQPCAAKDARAQFFLHIIPAHPRDLLPDRREHGFNNLGVGEVKISDGVCVALRDLPGYPIQRIRTGQFTDTGELWRTDITLSE